MLNSIAYMQTNVDLALWSDVHYEIEGLLRYFYKFDKNDPDEARQQTIMHVLKHFDPQKGNLNAYIKKLAREILKVDDKTVPIEFLEEVLGDGDEVLEVNNAQNNNVQHTIDYIDFSDDIIDKIDAEMSIHQEITTFILSSLDKHKYYIVLCEALIRRDTASTYYPPYFMREAMRLSAKYKNFTEQILEVYYEYGEEIKWFLNLEDKNIKGSWKEADFHLIKNRKSKKVKFVSTKTDEEVVDADMEDFKLDGVVSTVAKERRIFKVAYEDIWTKLCDMIDDTESNEMKFCIRNMYIVRTLGGSLSQVNADLYALYDLIRDEIVTNILYDTGCKLISVGSENIYLLSDELTPPVIKTRNVNGITLDFTVEDITDTILDN